MIKKFIVRLRMWYADIRGHHGKRWDYEPGEWYMGKHRKKKEVIDETYNELKKETKFTFKLLNLIKKCREKGKFNLYAKLIKKYNIDEVKLEEAYYD